MNNNLNNNKSIVNIILNQYLQSIKTTKKGKSIIKSKQEYIFENQIYRFECTFNVDEISIQIFSLKNINNNIHFTIYFHSNFAEIHNVNKNFNNETNTTYNPKNLINLIIKICKILNLDYIDLSDESFFMCHSKKIDLHR